MTISRHLLIFLALTWLGTVLVLGWVALDHRRVQAERLILESQRELVAERATAIQVRFDEIPKAHRGAQDSFHSWYDQLSPAQVEKRFQAAFIHRADGTWRSRDILFDGGIDPTLGSVAGIGAFVAPGAIDDERKRIIVSALSAVLSVSPGQRHLLKNLWFVTPTNDLIIFSPDRPDKLDYYRRHALSDSPFGNAPFIRSVMPDANPESETKCTGLSLALWDLSGDSLVASCQTPANRQGRFVGAWGTTLLMNSRLAEIVHRSNEELTVLLAGSDGNLIAGPGFDGDEAASAEAIDQLSRQYSWDAIRGDIDPNLKSKTINQPNLPWLVSYAQIAGPNWFLVYLRDRSAIADQMLADLPQLVVMGFILLAIQVGAVLVFVRRRIQGPLRDLADRYTIRDRYPEPSRPKRAPQLLEIKNLEQRLASAWERDRQLVQGLEAKIEERTHDLSLARDRSEAAARAKDVFLANMSHEIRTPLNGVIAMADVLSATDMTGQQQEIVELIRSSGDALEHLLSDILDASKIEAGKLDLKVELIDLCRLIEATALGFRAKAVEKGLTFEIHCGPGAGGSFLGDDLRIRQIVANLVSNAVKFTEHGGIFVRVESEETNLGMSTISIIVEDSGVGFSEEIGRRLFGRFEQADGSATRRIGGSGLGLSISRSLATLMNGTLSATSRPGEGSRFVVTLPLKRCELAIEPQQGRSVADGMSAKIEADLHASSGPLRILVAEDHLKNRRVIELILEQIGASIRFAVNGREAIEACKAETFDVVMMDMQMPEMDGLAASRAIRAHETQCGLPRTPIIMVSANAMTEHVQQAIAAGCDAHVSKPLTPRSLIQAIADVVKNPAAGSESVTAA